MRLDYIITSTYTAHIPIDLYNLNFFKMVRVHLRPLGCIDLQSVNYGTSGKQLLVNEMQYFCSFLGCLWNPRRDLLCILSKQQCSFFYSHAQSRGSYALPALERYNSSYEICPYKFQNVLFDIDMYVCNLARFKVCTNRITQRNDTILLSNSVLIIEY